MTDEERARIKAEAEATLKRLADFPKSYEPPGDGQPNRVHRHDLPPPEDPVSKWRREADAQEARFAAARAERRRQEREDERTAREMDARTQRAWDEYVDRRIAAALAAQQDNVAELARGSVEFSNAVCKRLRNIEKMLEQLSAKLTELRALDDQHRVVDMPSPLRPRSVN